MRRTASTKTQAKPSSEIGKPAVFLGGPYHGQVREYQGKTIMVPILFGTYVADKIKRTDSKGYETYYQWFGPKEDDK